MLYFAIGLSNSFAEIFLDFDRESVLSLNMEDLVVEEEEANIEKVIFVLAFLAETEELVAEELGESRIRIDLVGVEFKVSSG